MFCVKRLDAWEIKPTERIEAFQVCQVPTKYQYCNIACLKSSHVLVNSTQMYPYPILKALPRWKIYFSIHFFVTRKCHKHSIIQSLFNVLFTLQEISILKEELQQNNSAPITFEQVKSEVYVF